MQMLFLDISRTLALKDLDQALEPHYMIREVQCRSRGRVDTWDLNWTQSQFAVVLSYVDNAKCFLTREAVIVD